MRSFSSTDLANNTGDVLAAAAQSAVEIKRHGKTRFVILSVDQFEDMKTRGDTRKAIHIDDMSGAETDQLIAELEAGIEHE